MSHVIPVTTMIFTLNEEGHLPSCLSSLKWCDDVIVIDSFSVDRTEDICREHRARFYQNAFEGFGSQRNWALANTLPKHEWILILDADERVSPELIEEFRNTINDSSGEIAAFRLKRRFHMWGRWLKHSSLYPTYVVRLIRKGRVSYVNRGHAETQEVDGHIAEMKHDLIDENLKGIDEWFARQNRYSTKDAEFELDDESTPLKSASMFDPDPLVRRAMLKRLARVLPGRPAFYFFYSYVLRLGFLDGHDGFVFCLMKSLYQCMIVVKKHDIRRRRRGNSEPIA